MLSDSFNKPLYAGVLKEFKNNYKYEKGKIMGKVQNKKIEFDAAYLGELFEVSNIGYELYFRGSVQKPLPEISIDSIVEHYQGNPKLTYVNHNNFTPLQKLLFEIVHNDVVPPTQKRD